MQVTVVGAGVVGLTTACTLGERGHEVRVVAAQRGVDSSSGAAGAVWFPYGGELGAARERVDRWARETYRWLVELADVEGAGVDAPRVAYEAEDSDATPDWRGALPREAGLTWIAAAELPDVLRRCGDPPAGAWRFDAPVVVPAAHLAWLASRLQHPIELREVDDLDGVEGDVVVNCTGVGAGALTGDEALAPRLGQTVVASAGDLPRDEVLMDDRGPSGILYAIPRGDGGAEVVLGGIDVPTSGGVPTPDPKVTAELLQRHRARGLVIEEPIEARAGLRPGRIGGPRIERIGRAIHCYGHGGAGFTLARGCALDVAELAEGPGSTGSTGSPRRPGCTGRG